MLGGGLVSRPIATPAGGYENDTGTYNVTATATALVSAIDRRTPC